VLRVIVQSNVTHTKGEHMLRNVTRMRLIQLWFVGVALVVAIGVMVGAGMTMGTGIMLAALSLVPPAVLLMLWPGAQPLTVAEVIHEAERN
jgi:hypothetical protein